MKKILEKLWAALTAYPNSWDDYVGVGRLLIYKKLLAILALLALAAACLLPWLLRPAPAYEIPVFVLGEDRLKAYSGEAIITDGGNVIYRGQVSAGLRSGYGKELAPSEEQLIYEGGFLLDAYSGQGRLYQNGTLLYEGCFLNGIYEGNGVLYENGALLDKGGFSQGEYDGSGVLFRGGVKEYQGGFTGGVYQGEGILFDSQGRTVYTGGFRGGNREGTGTETTPEGLVIYEGGFKNGFYHGSGRLYAADGIRVAYEGEFVNGTPNRSGSLFNSRGQLLYTGALSGGLQVDIQTLPGLSMKDAQAQIHELPDIYYGGGYVGFLYRELGIALLSRYDYSSYSLPAASAVPGTGGGPPEALPGELQAPDASDPFADPGLFSQPEDNLVVNVLLAGGPRYYDQVPIKDGVEIHIDEITGFELFMQSRLASVQDPAAALKLEAQIIQRGDHLYEVIGLAQTASYDGTGVFSTDVSYFWETGGLEKGGVPNLLFCRKAKFGG